MGVAEAGKRVGMGAAVAVAFVALQTVLRYQLGPEADWWEDVRRENVPVLHRFLEDYGLYATYPMAAEEYAGTFPHDPETVEEILADEGFVRNPVAALKTRGEGQREVGSWVCRESPIARRQFHVVLFRRPDDEGTDAYAHEEYSSLNPTVAYEHHREVDYDPEAGVERARELFDLKRPGPATDHPGGSAGDGTTGAPGQTEDDRARDATR